MVRASIVIPNYNGKDYIEKCMEKLCLQTESNFEVIVVDNCSEDESVELISQFSDRLNIRIIQLDNNYGFSKAVNDGIKASLAEYVILLNNDAFAGRHFVEELIMAMDEDDDIFSAQALMLQYADRSIVDTAGDYFTLPGFGFSDGKDKKAAAYSRSKDIFSACAGAAVYRRKIFDEIGYFDENFFAYLEDMDIGMRARLYGYRSILVPSAKVLHVGSGSSGSRHNAFKVSLSARNSFLLMYKNYAPWQKIVNAPFILAGVVIKTVFFARKGLAREYLKGVMSSFSKMKDVDRVTGENLDYMGIQRSLCKSLLLKIGMR